MPSPRRPDPELMGLGNETARLILDAMRSALKVLKPEHVASFARTEFKVAITAASPTLLNTVKSETNSVLSHARLINALFAKKLADSQVGKAMLSLRKAVMDQYDGHTFTLKDFDAMEEEQLAFKKRQLLNMEDQAKACAQIFLEVDQYDLSSSKLPPELIAFWKTIDHGLCAWAAENPQLDQKDLSAARSNLGFDLLVTRLALPLLAGPESESHLVIPQQFCSAAKNAIVKNWPDFFDRFLVATGLERGSQAKETQATVGVASALPAAAPGQGAGASASLAAPSFDASVSGRDEKGGE